MSALLVALGAAFGAPARYLVTRWLQSRGGTARAGTLVVNVVGSLILGACAGAAVTGHLYALIGVGFCGALTTFSTLGLQVWDACSQRQTREAAADVALTLLLGVGAAALGFLLTG